MANSFDFEVVGNDTQMLVVKLRAGQTIRSRPHTMCYKTEPVVIYPYWDRSITGPGMLHRAESLLTAVLRGGTLRWIAYGNNSSHTQEIGFSSPVGGRIIPLDLGSHAGCIYCRSDVFLCSGDRVECGLPERERRSWLRAQQRLSGDGMVFLQAHGVILEIDLEAGQKLDIQNRCLVAYTEKLQVAMHCGGRAGRGWFDGTGSVRTLVTGPGRVWVQSASVMHYGGAFVGGGAVLNTTG